MSKRIREGYDSNLFHHRNDENYSFEKKQFDLWIPSESWQRINTQGTAQQFHYFPFELVEEDYLRRIYSILADSLTHRLYHLLALTDGTWMEPTDILTLLNIFITAVTNELNQLERKHQPILYELQKSSILDINTLLDKLQELVHYKVYLFISIYSKNSANVNNNSFDLSSVCSLAREVLQFFAFLKPDGIIEGGEEIEMGPYNAAEEVNNLEKQYLSHKEFKEQRIQEFSWNRSYPASEDCNYGRSRQQLVHEVNRTSRTYPTSNGFPISSQQATGAYNHGAPSAVTSYQSATTYSIDPSYYEPQQFRRTSTLDEIDLRRSPLDLLNRGYTAASLKKAFTVKELRNLDISVEKLLHAGYTVAELKDGGYSARRFKSIGFSCNQLKEAGFSAGQVLSAGYSLQKLVDVGYSIGQMKGSKIPANQLIQLGFTTAQLKEGGYTAADLRTLGKTAEELFKINYPAAQLKAAGYELSDLVKAGYQAGQLRGAHYTAEELLNANMTLQHLREGGFSAASLKQFVSSAAKLKEVGYSAAQAKEAGYSLKELKDAGYLAPQLKAAKFSLQELKDGGFTVAMLREAAFTGLQLREIGFTCEEMSEAGLTAAQLKSFGFSPNDLLNSGFTVNQLREAGFSLDDIRNSLQESKQNG